MIGSLLFQYLEFGSLPLFNSMYEVFRSLTTIAKGHFVYFFSGLGLSILWSNNLGASGTVTMNNSVDGGVTLQDTATASQVAMNNKREFVHNGCACIWIAKINNNASESEFGFLGDQTYTTLQSLALGGMEGVSSSTNFTLDTEDGTTESVTVTSVVADTNYHTHKIVCGSSNVTYYIDGVLQATKTTNNPIAKMQLGLVARSRSGTTGKVTALMVEAYNT